MVTTWFASIAARLIELSGVTALGMSEVSIDLNAGLFARFGQIFEPFFAKTLKRIR